MAIAMPPDVRSGARRMPFAGSIYSATGWWLFPIAETARGPEGPLGICGYLRVTLWTRPSGRLEVFTTVGLHGPHWR
jgi:hypothetical protein